MPPALNQENLDLLALQLAEASTAEQVTCLKLLECFDSIDGFWLACVEMVTPTSADLRNLLPNSDVESVRANGSMEQVIEIGIRDQTNNLTASFCDWFDCYCEFKSETGTRNFLLPHLRPAEYADLNPNLPSNLTSDVTRSPPWQLHTKFALTVIKQVNIAPDATAAEIYPSFVQKAIELADDVKWDQDLSVEVQPGSGLLVVKYNSTGNANRVSKPISIKRFRELLVMQSQRPHLS